jgi:transcription initiation factor TFIIIB Brf1 subunit/transcription initiation factor TFIIB
MQWPSYSPIGYENDVKCGDCGSVHFVLDWSAGDKVCTGCGLVLEGHIIDDRPEWRNYADSGSDKSRCGEAYDVALSQKPSSSSKGPALTTVIPNRRDTKHQQSSTLTTIDKMKLKRTHVMLNVDYKEKCLRSESSIMDGCMQSQFFSLPESLRISAIRLYTDFRKKRKVKQELQPPLMAVCAMTASRQSAPRTLSEVCNAFGVDKKQVSNARKDLRKMMKEDADMMKEYGSLLCGKGGDTMDAMTRIVHTVFAYGYSNENPHDGNLARHKASNAKRWNLLKRCKSFDEFAKRHDLVGSNDPERYAMAIVLVASQDMGLEITEDLFTSLYTVSTNTLAKHSKVLRTSLLAEGVIQIKGDGDGVEKEKEKKKKKERHASEDKTRESEEKRLRTV